MAARLADAKGDEAQALKTLEGGLKRYPQASNLERARAYLYRAELALRVGDRDLAAASLTTATSIELDAQERELIADEAAHITEILN